MDAFSGILLWDVFTWPSWFMASYCAIILGGMEILGRIPDWFFKGFKRIPIKGKHLDAFSFTDNAFIITNKLLTVVFVYHLAQGVYYLPSIKKLPEEATLLNTVGSFIAFYVVYDFFYANFHRILHFRSLYALIHKHHHRQKAPSRGNLDAINVHPFEYFVGEYLHLVTIYLVPCHIYAVTVFILLAGVFASLNHTRYDIVIPWLFSVKNHDVHHRLPESNYGQYTMLWDAIQGSFRAYDKVQSVKDMTD
jgi:sterol desaturase/sphingolipid hydroxylase (fatty acid hydroxylase superfamily)